MDINEEEYENDKAIEVFFDITKSHYTIYSCPPIESWPTETIAFAVLCPTFEGSGGAIKLFNIDKHTFAQGFLTNTSNLRRRFIALKQLITKNRDAKLVWEGKVNGYNETRTTSIEPTWLN